MDAYQREQIRLANRLNQLDAVREARARAAEADDDAVIAATARRPREVEGPDEDGSWVPAWLEIGRANPWIRGAWDPPFTAESFKRCPNFDALADALEHGNWSLGSAFWAPTGPKPLCFIQQVNGGNEWLVIRGGIPFESFSYTTRQRLLDFVHRAAAATDEQLRRLDY